MRTVDCTYAVSEERLREYAKVPAIERLRWLDELVRFTLLWRAAPRMDASRRGSTPGDRPGSS
jgi:hypothetical protein